MMGCCKRLLLITTVLTAIFLGYVYHKLMTIKPLPEIEVDQWWGSGSPKKIDASIRTFKIEFTDDLIADLKDRLNKTPALTTPLEETGFEYGFNNIYLKKVLDFWSKNYKFKEREAFLNQYPHFKTNIQGLDIHYIHIKPTVSRNIKVIPLLLSHGWPGSVREFYEIIPLLSTPRKEHDFVFELIIPSLPGYGFSQPAAKVGLGSDKIAIILRNLMRRLGHAKYYVQGGDWGAHITQMIAMFFPNEVLGLHSNMALVQTEMATVKWILGSLFPSLIVDDIYRDRLYPLLDKIQYLIEETGYMHLQATKPDTVGVSLQDSPAGLAAYILEKFSVWTNPKNKNLADGGLTNKYTLTDLLDNIMIYWSTASITTSMRLYSETFNIRFKSLDLDKQPINTPSAIANFKHELSYHPEYILKDRFTNIVQISHFEDGGHFAAFEVPQLLADDVWMAVSKMRLKPSTNTKDL